jgi:hypothetical protein
VCLQLASRVGAIIANLEEPPSTYAAEASRNWSKLIDGFPRDYRLQVIAALKEVTLGSALSAADTWIFSRETRQSAMVMICAAAHEKDMVNAFNSPALPVVVESGTEVSPSSTAVTEFEPFFDPIDPSSKMFCDLQDVSQARDGLQYPA